MMKKFNNILLLAALALATGACDKDGDFLTVSQTQDVTLAGTDGELVLNYETADALALTVYWTDNGQISLSNPLVAAPENASVNTLQFSATDDFATVAEQEANAGEYSMQFTHFELNAILNNLGFPEGVGSPLYIRVESSLGENVAPSYSNVTSVNVTPYVIDMTVGYLLTTDMAESGLTLYSPTSNGIYSGFVGCASWWNFFMREGNGTIWGNDGVAGTPFLISSEASRWNMWYPGQTGCYYTIIDTQALQWSAMLVNTMTVGGDVTGEMTYTRATNSWTYSYNAAAAGPINITISGTGSQYNLSTGTDDAAAIATTFGFTQNGDAVEYGSTAGTISLDVPAGDVTITLDLSNPAHYTCSVETGAGPVVPDNPLGDLLYFSGVDDGITGSWTFDNYLRRYNEDSNLYGGACNVNSLWGYRFYLEADNWDDCYLFVEGDAYSGTIKANDGSESNIPAPEPGLYLYDVSMTDMTYQLTAITSVSYTGLNDDWNLAPMTATDEPGVYTAAIEIAAVSPWGFQIIINDNWDLKFGGSEGILYLYGSNITDDATVGVGSYTLTVDLCAGTYTIE